ncbi:MAG: hypothetical protein ABJA61_01180 [Caldimonas sp.]
MTIMWSLRRWSSATVVGLHAAEVLPAPADADALGHALNRVAGDLADSAFLLVRVGRCDGDALRGAIATALAKGLTTRLCLAADRATLEQIAALGLDDDRVGLVLDDVTIDTPLSAFVWDRLEAVRFDADFVARAARNLRAGCALEAMLRLARNLGLCTLGSDAMPGGAALAEQEEFDYLPAPLAAAGSTIPLSTRVHAGAPADIRLSR